MPRGIGYGKKKSKPKKTPSPKLDVIDAKYQAEDDARTLMRAEEIKCDKARIKAAQAQAKKQIAELARVVKK